MLPENLDGPRIYRGDGWQWQIEFYSDENLTVPVDLTVYGDTWASQGQQPNGEVVDFTVDDSNAATGILVLSLAAADSEDLKGNHLDYDVQGTPAVGDPTTIVYGRIGIEGDITHVP